MAPTESYKTKSIGKVTSKQRLMEMFESLDFKSKEVSVLKKSNTKNKKKSYTLGQSNPYCKKTQNQVRVSIKDLVDQHDKYTASRTKSAYKSRTPVARDKGKAKLFMYPPTV